MVKRPSWRAWREQGSGWVRAVRARAGRRAYRLAAAATALAVAVALTVVALVLPTHPGPPVQQAGTAAGRPHRVPASATIASLSGDKVVRSDLADSSAARAARAAAALRAAPRPKGAVPPAAKPPRIKLGVRTPGHDRLRSLRSPAVRPVRGFNARTSRLLTAGTSANQVEYQNADGTRTALFYQSPVNYRRPDGSWVRIDTNLEPQGGSSSPAPTPSPSPMLPSASPTPLISPAIASPSASASSATPTPGVTPTPTPSPSTSAAQAPQGWRETSAAEPETFAPYANASPLIVLPLGSQGSVGMSVMNAAHMTGSATGSTVTYAGVRPDADLRVVAGTGNVDEQVILDSASAPDTWVFPLRLDGLKAVTGPGGTIEFTDAAGKVVAYMPHGLMSDSNIDPRSGNGATSTGVSYALTTADGQPAIQMTLDTAWLDSPARVFPVTVDPSVGSYNSSGTTYVLSPNDSDYSGDTEIDVGTYDGGSNVARSFMAFGNVASSLTNDTVLGAVLGVFDSWSYSCSPRSVDVYPVTSSWSVTGAKSYPGPSIGASVGSKSFATGWVPEGSTVSPCPARWEGIDLNQAGTQLVNGWAHGTTPDDGLALGASSSDSYGWKKFTSINTSNGDPFLSVTYTPYGAKYDLASSQPVEQVSPTQNGELAIKVTNTGATTWTTSNGYELSYEVYNAAGKLVASHPVFTPMPSTVAPGASVVVDAKVDELPVGSYAIDFDMYADATTSPVSFLSQGIAPFPVGLYVPQPPPVVTGVYPPTGYISSTVTPQLSTTASSTTGTSITYQFSLSCDPLPGQICPASTVDSGSLTTPYWTTPALGWDEKYLWTVTATTNGASSTTPPVTITPEVPQPAMTLSLGSSGDDQAFDPQSGNFTTSATDAAVAVAGPPLQIGRTYNSLDPRSSGAFGAGWSSVLDTAVIPDNDGTGNVVVALPNGQQMRFGYNSALNTYAPPMGSPDVLVHNSSGTWTLMDSSGNQYEFTSAGQLEQITNTEGLTQTLTANSAGEITTITDTASGRTLTLTWSTPSGASYPHVASVTTSPPASGQAALAWDYSYTGDDLTSVCGPTGGCTSYLNGTGSNYRSAVLDSGPRSYWQFGDASGSTSAADEVDANLGTTSGTYSNVTLGTAGPLAGSTETAASFNGTSSYVSLPANLITDQNYVSIGVWFKAASSTASGVLFGYQADALSNSSGDSAAHVPALYVGGNGDLYGELYNGKVDPMSSSVNVDDGNWHYAVLTGSATSQSLWLDGTEVATMTGQISPDGMTVDSAGAGFWGSGWPEDYVTVGPSLEDTPIGYFDGSIGQLAVYPRPLGQAAITQQYALAKTASAELTQVTLPSGRIYQQASYNPSQDRIVSYTDSSGGQWQIHPPVTTGYKASSDTLEEATRYVTVVDPAGYDEVYGYDALNGGGLVSFSAGNGDAPETFGYDSAGFLNQVQDSDGNLVTMTNDIHGNVLTRTWYPVEPASSGSTSSASSGARTGAVDGPEATDASSSSCTVTGAACTSYYTYYYNPSNPLDPRNDQLTGSADPRSASATDTTYLTTYAYNTAGELTSSTTPATSDFPSGRTTSDAYSTSSTAAYGGSGTIPAGLLVSTTTPGGAVTSYSYYSDGDLAQVTTPAGARTVYTYDGLGRALTATTYSNTYPSGLTTSYTYNDSNQLLTVTDPGVVNQVTGVTHTLQDAYTYDPDGHALSETQTDLTGGDPTRTATYTYNDFGELASVTGPAGATGTSGTAPAQGAPTANPQGTTTGYTYNSSGQVATMVDADGNEYDYAYNEYGETTQVALQYNSTTQTSPEPACPAGQVPGPAEGCQLVVDSYAYDPSGLLAAATDAMGRSTNYFYNGDDELVATQNLTSAGTGRQTAYTYDGAGNLIETDASNFPVTEQTVTDYNYDAANRLDSMVVDPTPAGTSDSGYANRTTSYTYNADNDVLSQTITGSGGSSTTDDGYNSADEMTSQAVVNGSTDDTTTWTYDTLGQVLGTTSPDGNASGATPANYTTNYSYDQAGNLAVMAGAPVSTQTYTAQTPASTRPVTVYGYDTFGDQTQVKDPDDNVTTTAYDGDGRVTSVAQPSYTPPGSSTAITATTKYAYDGNGNEISVTDPEGNVTSYAHDALGDVISVTDPLLTGQSAPGVSSYTYDSDGEQLSATSPTGGQTQATYDNFGDLASSTQDIRSSSGTAYDTTDYTYDYLGDPLTTTTPDAVVTTDTYDHLGELASTANSYGDTTSYAYNYAGQVSQVTNPDGTYDSYSYNPTGTLASTTAYGTSAEPGELPPVLSAQSYGYDPSGNLTSGTDGDGNTSSYAYNAADELTSLVQPVSSSVSDTTSYGYDAAGNQTSVTDGRGNTTWTTYNTWNTPQSVIEPATATATTAADRTWTTAYNADSLPVTVTQPGGITVSYGYNQMGHLTSESGSGAAAATPAQTFGYDLDGDLTSATAPGGTDSFTYNDAAQVTAASGPSGSSSFGYNADGLLTSETDAAGTTGYTYDNADRLATVADPLTGAKLTYGYNTDNLPTSIAYAEGSTAGPKQSLGYNGQQELTSDTLTSASGATIASAGYNYNADGDLTSQATAGYAGAASTSYGYNEADELTSATTAGTTTSYAYDADGDLTQAGATSYTYDAQDQPATSVTSAGTTSYGYTMSGALASVTPPSGTAQDYTSNAYGQTVTVPGGVSYAYDALGRLATRTTSSGTSDFSYSGTGNTVANDGTTSYSYDPSGDLIAAKPAGGTAEAALTDVHGDVTGLFGPASTTTSLAASAAYSPYGTATASSGTMPALGYQSQYTDPATGDTDMSARWYAPATGTFTSNDTLAGSPVSDTINPSPYGYAGGNPLTNEDLTGHCWFCLAPLVGLVEGARYAVGMGVADLASAAASFASEALALGGAIWALSSFFFPTPIGEACGPYSGTICGPTGGGGSPGPVNYGPPSINWGITWATPFWPGSSGYPCAGYCYAPQPPPPPPPPPQDCYAGPDPSCSPPPAPRSLRDGQHVTVHPENVTNPRAISRGHTIVEATPTEQQLLDLLHLQTIGVNTEPNENGASGQNAGGSTSQAQDPSRNVGKPASPTAAGGSGSSGGNPPPTTPASPEPPDDGPGYITRIIVDNNGIRAVTSPANGPEYLYQTSGPEFEQWQQNILENIASGESQLTGQVGSGIQSFGDAVDKALEEAGLGRVEPTGSVQPTSQPEIGEGRYNPPGAPTSTPPSGLRTVPFKIIFWTATAAEVIYRIVQWYESLRGRGPPP
jgi:RHS repeat-associated protein